MFLHSSTGLFSRKTLPIALQTYGLGAFLAETRPNRRTQGICTRTFAQNVLEKRVTMPHRAHFRNKRARMKGRGAESRALLPENARGVRAAGEFTDSHPGSGESQRAAGSKSNSGSGKCDRKGEPPKRFISGRSCARTRRRSQAR